MNKQLDIETKERDNHWLNMAETIALVGSVGGSIASIFVEEIALASIPLSACVALNLINRQRLLNLIDAKNEKAIATLSQQNQNDHNNIRERAAQIEQSIREIQNKSETDRNDISQQLQQIDLDIQKINSQYAQLASKTAQMVQSTTSGPAELYYQNANSYQQMGELELAISEYTKAIEIDDSHAEAYVGRSLLFADMGKQQEAVDDLRQAAKSYFDREDLENYQQIKQKVQDIHKSKTDSTPKQEDSEAVLASSLFS